MSKSKAGRKFAVNPLRVAGWRQTRNASIAETATHFGISRRTVTNYCRDHGQAAADARAIWKFNKEVADIEAGRNTDALDYSVAMVQALAKRAKGRQQS
jgi:hypothetical protein